MYENTCKMGRSSGYFCHEELLCTSSNIVDECCRSTIKTGPITDVYSRKETDRSLPYPFFFLSSSSRFTVGNAFRSVCGRNSADMYSSMKLRDTDSST